MDGRPATTTPTIPGIELFEVVGSGGSGIVYRGRQQDLGRDVAVKVVSTSGAGDETIERWRREIAAMGRLSNHPNILGVYAAGQTDDGLPYLIMPFVPGGTLRTRIDRDGPMAAVEVAEIGVKLAGALSTAHAAGVLHRDVKPDNVLMSPYGEPQLTDFGIARLADRSTTVAGSLQATVPYAAPEVLGGERASERSDVYSLGATLYACLAGHAPYLTRPDESWIAMALRIMSEPPSPLVACGVPGPLVDVVERAMAREPEHRVASAADLAGALAEAGGEIDPSASITRIQPALTTALIVPAVDAPTDTIPTARYPTVSPAEPTSALAETPTQAVPRPDDRSVAAPSTPAVGREARPSDRARRNRRWLAPIALLAVAAATLLAATAVTEGDRSEVGGVPDVVAAPETSAAAPQSSEAAPTTTDAPSTATEPPTTATARPEGSDSIGTTPADAALRYLEALDAGEFDRAWSLTTPRFQARQDRDGWRSFWGGFDSIDVVGEPQVSGGTVVVPLSFDGQREDYTMTLVEQRGAWLIDGPVGG